MRKQFIAAGLAATAFFASAAQATVIASNSTPISQDAQYFSRTYSLDGTKYTGVTVSITAKGDYGTNYNVCDDEYFNFSIDGTQFTHWSSSSTAASGVSVTQNSKDTDYTLSGTISLTDAQWAKISADNLLTVSWQNGSEVDAYWSWLSGWVGSVSFSVQGSIMPSTSPIATTPVASTPVVTTPVTTTPTTGTTTGTTSGSTAGATTGATSGSAASTAVPEPGSIALLGLGLAGLGLVRLRRRKA